MSKPVRASWGSKLGLILASAGSAVGLGNLWRFPFIAAENGGGSFLFIYLICTFSVGISLVFAEAALGIKTKSDPIGAFAWIRPGLKFIGAIGVFTSTIIVPYYSVVGGWIVAYIVKSFSVNAIENFETHFTQFISSPLPPVLFFYVYLLATAAVVYMGIEKGIEKFCKLIMPMLFLLLLVLMVRVLTLDNAWEGVKFFFMPDFSKITAETMLAAMGQVFFSISAGMGIYITYGSYVKDDIGVGKTMWPVVSLDALVSLLTGLTIFPAVFAFGLPMNAGPSLTFITLPKIFAAIPFGQFFGLVFFVILLGAAITSSISLMEVVTTFLCDQAKMTRKKAVVVYTALCLATGTLVSLSFGKLSGFKIGGKILFDQFDFLASNILLPTGGLLTSIAIGWILGPEKLVVFKNKQLQFAFEFCIKWIAPVSVLAILLNAVGII